VICDSRILSADPLGRKPRHETMSTITTEPTKTFPIPTLKPPFTELLKASGVRSTQDLARNHPAKLLRWMEEVNSEKRIVRRMPPIESVTEWVEVAQHQHPVKKK
jgi:hypothetical protein